MVVVGEVAAEVVVCWLLSLCFFLFLFFFFLVYGCAVAEDDDVVGTIKETETSWTTISSSPAAVLILLSV